MTSMQQYHDDALDRLRNNVNDADGFLWTGGKEAQVLADMILRKTDLDVTFLTVETGNQLDSVKAFRDRFHADHGFEWERRAYYELQKVVRDDADPRGYHGRWDSSAGEPEYHIENVPEAEDEWTVAASCGALKTVPLRRFIETDGYDTLVTGIRGDDPLTDAEEFGAVVKRSEPVRHTRVNPLHDWGSEQVWAYLSREFVPYPDCYNEGYRHTDSECCIEDDAVSEHGEGGRDPEKEAAADRLRDMGYV